MVKVSTKSFRKAQRKFPRIVGRKVKGGYITDSKSMGYALRKK